MVPVHSEYIIEGEIAPYATHVEGPHGEAGGFYGQNLEAAFMTVTCITHRRNPINYGVICLLEEDYPRWLFRSGSFEARIKNESGLTSIRHAFFPEIGGRSWGAAVVSAEINDPEEPLRIIDAVWKIVPNQLGHRRRRGLRCPELERRHLADGHERSLGAGLRQGEGVPSRHGADAGAPWAQRLL